MKKFKAESERLLDLMINSIYTNKEIFLRELISNASDATDKMYIKSLKDKDIDFNRDNFYIYIDIDRDKRLLKIEDYGIGMTKEDLEEDLGTIARSGSLDFIKDNKDEDLSIIGQFGVGFYSGFMVSDKIDVISKAYGSDKAYMWSSSGAEGYEIVEADRKKHGSTVILHIRKDQEYDKYLEEYTIRELVKKYSNYIKYPIKMEVEKYRPKKKENEEDKEEYESYKDLEVLNSIVPIWKKNRNELKDQDYIDFYKEERFGFDEPLLWTHLVLDGSLSYRAILYIPSSMPYNYYTKEYKKGLELYSNGVLIMEHSEELLSDHYSFVKGVVDSQDLSLNISRELVQQDRQLQVIAKKIESKITEELKKLMKNDREKYIKFFNIFGNQIKAGIYQSFGSLKDPLSDLLIFNTSEDKKKSLDEYIENMKEDQEYIYYASGDSIDAIKKNPALEIFNEKNIEILYFTDELDEFVIQMIKDYKDKKFKSAFSEDIDLMEEDKDQEKDQADLHNEEEVLKKMKDILKDEVVDVRKSKRLKEGAISLIASGPISIEMEKAFMNQANNQEIKAQKILEINVNHPVFKKLEDALSRNDNEKFEDYTRMLYDQARLIEGLTISDPVEFSKRIIDLM